MKATPYSVLEYFTCWISPVTVMVQTAQMHFNLWFIYSTIHSQGQALIFRFGCHFLVTCECLAKTSWDQKESKCAFSMAIAGWRVVYNGVPRIASICKHLCKYLTPIQLDTNPEQSDTPQLTPSIMQINSFFSCFIFCCCLFSSSC